MKKLFSLLVLSFLTAFPSIGQPKNLELIRHKTESRLQETVREVSGVAGFIAVDLTSGEQFAINENMLFPQGSAIKIPILMEVYKQAAEGSVKLTDRLTVKSSQQVGGSGILHRFGDETSLLSVRDLCVLMIMLSDNTATNMLIDLIGMKNVNSTIRGLGLKETKLQRRMIDQSASKRGEENLSTPAEAAKIMALLYKGEFINRETCDAILEILKMPRRGAINVGLPENISVAFKPGAIPGVYTEWGIVYNPSRPYVFVAMVNYSLRDEASKMMEKASQLVFDYYSRLGKATSYGTYVE